MYLVFVDHKFPFKIDDVISYIMPSLQLIISCDFLGKGESTQWGAILDHSNVLLLGIFWYILGVFFL
jgi:hypothetical protein